MSKEDFPLSLLQAVNDWQIGGNAKQKAVKGKRLAELSSSLPGKFREVKSECYRQIAIEGAALYKLNDNMKLSETISAWTSSLTCAEQIKGGVPQQGYQGIIFSLKPSNCSVILNLDRLYGNKQFLKALSNEQNQIERFGDGIGRYRNTQREVILKLEDIKISQIVGLGGFSNSREQLAKIYFKKDTISFLELLRFDKLLNKAEAKIGPHWIYGLAKDRCIAKIQAKAPKYRAIKILQNLSEAEDKSSQN